MNRYDQEADILYMDTPLRQKVGNQVIQLNPETDANQVWILDRLGQPWDLEQEVLWIRSELGRIDDVAQSKSANFVRQTIEERDALNPNEGDKCLVLNASGDSTVNFGSATYVWTGSEWEKTGEEESMDVTLLWEKIVGRPNSSVDLIDEAVRMRHMHNNKDTLDKLADSGSNLLFRDVYVGKVYYTYDEDFKDEPLLYKEKWLMQDGSIVFVIGEYEGEKVITNLFELVQDEFIPVDFGIRDILKRLQIAEDDIDALEDRCTLLEDRCTNLEDRCTNLETRMYNAELRIEAVEERCTNLEDRCTNLENRMTAAENEINKLWNKIDEVRTELYEYIDENVATLNERITNEVATLNNRIDQEVLTLNDRIDQEVLDLNDRIDNEVQTLNDRIDKEVEDLTALIKKNRKELDERIDSEVKTLNDRIDTEVSTLNTRIDTEVETINTRIDTEVETLNTRIDTEVETLNQTISDTKDEINDRIDDEVKELNDTIKTNRDELDARIDSEVEALETSIQEHHDEINGRVTQEVATLNNTIETTKNQLIEKYDAEVERLDGRIDDLDQKVDKSVNDLNDRIDTEVTNLTTIINDNRKHCDDELARAESELNTKIDGTKTELQNSINTLRSDMESADSDLSDRIDALDKKVNDNDDAINEKVDTNVERIDGRIDALEQTVADNKAESESADNALSERITNEVNTINNTIKEKDDAINEKVDGEVERLDGRIDALDKKVDDTATDIRKEFADADKALDEKYDAEVDRIDGNIDNLNTKIDTEVSRLDDKIDGLGDDLAEAIDDLDIKAVHLAGEETITGQKTFTQEIKGDVSGYASKLKTARKINNTLFDGTQDITTDKWGTSRNIRIVSGNNKGEEVAVDGSKAYEIPMPTSIDCDVNGNATSADKLTVNDTGNGKQLMNFKDGVPSLSTESVGGEHLPVYVNNGQIVPVEDYLEIDIHGTATVAQKVGTETVGSNTNPVWINAGVATASNANIGSETKPVYFNAGVITEVGSSLDVNITGIANKATYDINGNKIAEYYAPIDSPSFLGVPVAPTPDIDDNSTKIATTGWVKTVIGELVGAAPESLDTIYELAAALQESQGVIDNLLTNIALKANDADVVHLAGAETITGQKTFTANPIVKNVTPSITIQDSNAIFSTDNSGYGNNAIYFTDQKGQQMGSFTQEHNGGNSSLTKLVAYDVDGGKAEVGVRIGSDGKSYGFAPTPDSGATGNKIATVDWVANATVDTANKLSVNAGTNKKPIYFENGVPVQTDDTLDVSVSGNAATSTKLTSSAGTNKKPIYFSDGKPVQCDATLDVSISGSAASCTGVASSADKLNVDGGSSTVPVYFENGVPVALTSLSLDTSGNAATATTASKLSSDAGSATQPVYFKDGVPVQVGSSLDVSVTGSSASCTGNASSATKLTSSAGTSTKPIYFKDGKPTQCDGTLDVSISGSATSCTGTADNADTLKTARNLKVNLATTNAQSFNGSADATSIGVSGVLPVANGGTGCSVIKGTNGFFNTNFNESLTSPDIFVVATNSFDKAGYISVANAKTLITDNCVHLTGNETVSGSKKFTDWFYLHSAFILDKASVVSTGETTKQGTYYNWVYNNYDGYNRIGFYNTYVFQIPQEGDTYYPSLFSIKPVYRKISSISTDSSNTVPYGFHVGMDGKGTMFVKGPTPPAESNSKELATTEWINNKINAGITASKLGTNNVGSVKTPIYLNEGVPTACTQVINTEDSQTITGNKTFVSDALRVRHASVSKGGTQTSSNTGIHFGDKNNTTVANLSHFVYSDRIDLNFTLYDWSSGFTNYGQFGLRYDTNAGIFYGFTPKPPSNHNGNSIPTTSWVIDKLGDGSVTKVGTSNVGSSSTPIYLNGGVPTAVTLPIPIASGGTGATTVSNAVKMLFGTAHTTDPANFATVSNAYSNPGYMTTSNVRKLLNGTSVGSSTQPVYINANGVPTACGEMFDLSNAQTITGVKTFTANTLSLKANYAWNKFYSNTIGGYVGNVASFIVDTANNTLLNIYETCGYDYRRMSFRMRSVKTNSSNTSIPEDAYPSYLSFVTKTDGTGYVEVTTPADTAGGIEVVNASWVKARLGDGSVTKIGTSNVGSSTTPIYLNGGVPTAVTGALPVSLGGTGATTVANAVKSLFPSSNTSPAYFAVFNDNYASSGFISAANAKTLLTDNCVHLTGSEDITGWKTFKSGAGITVRSTERGHSIFTIGESGTNYNYFPMTFNFKMTSDSTASYRTSSILHWVGTPASGETKIPFKTVLAMWDITVSGSECTGNNTWWNDYQLGIGRLGDGTRYTICPHPSADSDTTNIATTGWVRSRLKDGTVTKVGTGTVGSVNVPIYLNAGTPTAMTGALPIANGGTGNTTVSNAVKAFFGTQHTADPTNFATVSSNYANPGWMTTANVRKLMNGSTVGGVLQPVYINANGVPTVANTMVDLGTAQSITGVKTFNASTCLRKTNYTWNTFHPTSGYMYYGYMNMFIDPTTSDTLFRVYEGAGSNWHELSFQMRSVIASSSDSTKPEDVWPAYLKFSVNTSGEGFIQIPTARATDNNNNAANTAWVNTKLGNYVSLNGNQTITGLKQFQNNIRFQFPTAINNVVQTTAQRLGTYFYDVNNTELANLTYRKYTNNTVILEMAVRRYDGAVWSTAGLTIDGEGLGYFVLPNPPGSSNTTHAATTAWVRARMADGTVSKLGTGTVGSASLPIYLNAGVPTAMSGALPLSNGGTGATSNVGAVCNLFPTNRGTTEPGFLACFDSAWATPGHISMANARTMLTNNCVHLTGNETISGEKSFAGGTLRINTGLTLGSYSASGTYGWNFMRYVWDTNKNILVREIMYRHTWGIRFGWDVRKWSDVAGTDNNYTFFGMQFEKSDGSMFMVAPTPPATANGIHVATCAWVLARISEKASTLGTINAGNASTPIYFKNGVPTACTSVGSLTTNLGSITKGSTTKPVYFSSGSVTECSQYGGGTAVTLNNSSKAANTAAFYAPTTGGTSGYILKSNGATSAPTWVSLSDMSVGTATNSTNADKIRTIADDNDTFALCAAWPAVSTGTNYSSIYSLKNITVSKGKLTATSVTATSSMTAPTFNGNATTATTATKLGTANVGSASSPIYLSGGTPYVCTSITASKLGTSNVGSTETPIYLSAGTAYACSNLTATKLNCGTVGSTSQPVYFSSGVPKVCTGIDVNVQQSLSSSSSEFAILTRPVVKGSANSTTTTYFCNSVTIKPDDGSLRAKYFIGTSSYTALSLNVVTDTTSSYSATISTTRTSNGFTNDYNAIFFTASSNNDPAILIHSHSLSPNTDGHYQYATLGKDNPYYRWHGLYLNQSPNVSSDRRIKDNITDFDDDLLDAWKDVRLVLFDRKEFLGESPRRHAGAIAQEIEKVLLDKGVDPCKYSFFCKSFNKEVPEYMKDEYPEGTDMYSLKYEELLVVEAAYQRRRADRLEERISRIEKALHLDVGMLE